MHAVYHGHEHITALLVANHADPFALTCAPPRATVVSMCSKMGASCATLAARHGHVHVLDWLLRCGVPADEAPSGKLLTVSPLAVATVNERVDCVTALLKARVNIEAGVDDLGMTPLSHAAQFSNEATMDVLLAQ